MLNFFNLALIAFFTASCSGSSSFETAKAGKLKKRTIECAKDSEPLWFSWQNCLSNQIKSSRVVEICEGHVGYQDIAPRALQLSIQTEAGLVYECLYDTQNYKHLGDEGSCHDAYETIYAPVWGPRINVSVKECILLDQNGGDSLHSLGGESLFGEKFDTGPTAR